MVRIVTDTPPTEPLTIERKLAVRANDVVLGRVSTRDALDICHALAAYVNHDLGDRRDVHVLYSMIDGWPDEKVCWISRHGRDSAGKPAVRWHGKASVRVARAVWEIERGSIEPGRNITSHCPRDDVRCVNPAHHRAVALGTEAIQQLARNILKSEPTNAVAQAEAGLTTRYCRRGHVLLPGTNAWHQPSECGKCRTERKRKQREREMQDLSYRRQRNIDRKSLESALIYELPEPTPAPALTDADREYFTRLFAPRKDADDAET